MLYVFFGTDTSSVRTRAFETLATFGEGASTRASRITVDNYTQGMLAELAGSTSLFGEPQIVILDTLSEDEIVYEEVLRTLSLMGESANTFVLIEKGLSVAVQKECRAHAQVCEELKKGEEKLDVFALCDALIARDKKSLWLLFIALKNEGVSLEEIIGILQWQLKILRLAERTGSPEEAGQKSYPYNKAKRALIKFKKGEVDALARSLLVIYHEGHMGKRDTALALEEWILRV